MKSTYQEPYDFLNEHKLAVLSTASDEGDPWGSAIYYVVDESLSFYFLTQVGSKKYRNILKQSHAALTVADDDAQATVQASGIVEELPLGEEQNRAYRKLALVHPPGGKFSWKPPVSKLSEGQTIVLKMKPTMLQFADFKADSDLASDPITRII